MTATGRRRAAPSCSWRTARRDGSADGDPHGWTPQRDHDQRLHLERPRRRGRGAGAQRAEQAATRADRARGGARADDAARIAHEREAEVHAQPSARTSRAPSCRTRTPSTSARRPTTDQSLAGRGGSRPRGRLAVRTAARAGLHAPRSSAASSRSDSKSSRWRRCGPSRPRAPRGRRRSAGRRRWPRRPPAARPARDRPAGAATARTDDARGLLRRHAHRLAREQPAAVGPPDQLVALARCPSAVETVGRRAPTSWPITRCGSTSGIEMPSGTTRPQRSLRCQKSASRRRSTPLSWEMACVMARRCARSVRRSMTIALTSG